MGAPGDRARLEGGPCAALARRFRELPAPEPKREGRGHGQLFESRG